MIYPINSKEFWEIWYKKYRNQHRKKFHSWKQISYRESNMDRFAKRYKFNTVGKQDFVNSQPYITIISR